MSDDKASRGETPTYYGVAPCGCVKALTVNEYERRREVAKEIASWARNGFTVHSCKVKDVWDGTVALASCDACRPPAPKAKRNAAQDALAAWNAGKPIKA